MLILGGGAPKNFLLQTEPQLQEILGVAEKGHDYFIQITDARPDTGGLSGATPGRGGVVGQDRSREAARHRRLLCRLDDRAAAHGRVRAGACKPRKPRRLYKRLPEMMEALRAEYRKTDLYARYWPDAAADAAAAAASSEKPTGASPLSGKPRRRTRR